MNASTTTTSDTTSGARVRVQRDWAGFILDHGIWPITLLLMILAAAINPRTFLSAGNLTNILLQSSVLGVLVVGESLVLLAGFFDLSLESTLAFTAMIAAFLLDDKGAVGSGLGMSPFVVVPLMLAVGAVVGLINAFLVLRVKINAFIATLAMLIILRGLTLVLTSGQSIFDLPKSFTWLGSGSVVGLPIPATVMIAAFVIAWIITQFRVYGKFLYAIGGNQRAAFVSGIPVGRVVTLAFVGASMLAALGGWMLAGRLEASVAGMGTGIIFDVMAAAVIGGISLQGGRGNLLDALGGVLLLGIIGNMLTLAAVSPYWVDTIRGLLILFAVVIDSARGRYQSRRIATA